MLHHINIASPRASNQLFYVGPRLRIPSKFHLFFAGDDPTIAWIIPQIRIFQPSHSDSIPTNISSSKKQHILPSSWCHLLRTITYVEPQGNPIDGQATASYTTNGTSPRCWSASPSAAIAGFRASRRWSWRNLGGVVGKIYIYSKKNHVKWKGNMWTWTHLWNHNHPNSRIITHDLPMFHASIP